MVDSSQTPKKEAMHQAKYENEEFNEELEDLHYMIICYPDNINHIRPYNEK